MDNLAVMIDRFVGFDARCKRLPKKLRTWDAYLELRKRITTFQEVVYASCVVKANGIHTCLVAHGRAYVLMLVSVCLCCRRCP
jgi:hypothetical protein